MQPLAAKASAMPCPMPLVEPVMRAVFPVSIIVSFFEAVAAVAGHRVASDGQQAHRSWFSRSVWRGSRSRGNAVETWIR
ncbi:hypothetical protein MPLB_1810020 [Mesorhizobium sp. ORS 3324]|nr:hypothetical protein MPLB_1810020 [Mesorhizobium sp. ORS 3324]